jgi:hypothetical protein
MWAQLAESFMLFEHKKEISGAFQLFDAVSTLRDFFA